MSARDRLLLAAAKAYREQRGYPPEPTEIRARWLDRDYRPEHDDMEVDVTVSLRDLIEITRAAKDAERYRTLFEEAHQDQLGWLARWRRARECFGNDGRTWKARAAAALREMWLLSDGKRSRDDSALWARWSALTDPHVGTHEGTISKRAALHLLSVETGVEPGTIKQRLVRQGVRIGTRDL